MQFMARKMAVRRADELRTSFGSQAGRPPRSLPAAEVELCHVATLKMCLAGANALCSQRTPFERSEEPGGLVAELP